MYTCRECERPINQATEICPYCGADLTGPGPSEAKESAKKRSLASILLRWGLLLGVLMAALWGFLWFILPEGRSEHAARAERQAQEALREIRAALIAYAQTQPAAAGFPASLEVLGERVRAAAQKAQSEGYQVQYTPGPAGSDGLVHTFVLLARAGNYGYRNFYSDESGVLRATSQNRSATAQDPPI